MKKMARIATNLLCRFIPDYKTRKAIRNRMKQIECREQVLNDGCEIEGNVAVTKERVRFDISDGAALCIQLRDVFINRIYSLSCKDDAVVIDIGMNRAVASLYFAAKKNVRKVYAFEPFRPTVELAKKNLALNPDINSKIRVFEYGLGRKNETLTIPYSAAASTSMSTTHNRFIRHITSTETVEIKDAVEVLAPIVEENKNDRVIIKCDCEGAELGIFERLNEANLLENINVILMEYHFEKPDKLIKIFTENDFAVHLQPVSRGRITVGYLYAVKMQAG